MTTTSPVNKYINTGKYASAYSESTEIPSPWSPASWSKIYNKIMTSSAFLFNINATFHMIHNYMYSVTSSDKTLKLLVCWFLFVLKLYSHIIFWPVLGFHS